PHNRDAGDTRRVPMSNTRMVTVAAFFVAIPGLPLASMAQEKTDFAHDIVPILKARCVECHANGKYKGSVSFDTRADLLKSKAVVRASAVLRHRRRAWPSDQCTVCAALRPIFSTSTDGAVYPT